jgi:hypothetical protein
LQPNSGPILELAPRRIVTGQALAASEQGKGRGPYPRGNRFSRSSRR